ncbi:ATP-binding protein [Marinilabiliaceae bacterium ANBcel2]|nr:ATP-binding protein [Marinilabiliaceae bacterium ANBcel2]
MKEVTILSGKGGTGKTSVTAALASLAKDVILCDNDVDASNLHLILNPKPTEIHTFLSGWEACIDQLRCTKCGLCQSLCNFSAIEGNQSKGFFINKYQCEGCRLCERMCPSGAISSNQNKNNQWLLSDTRLGKLIHAKMQPGEDNSGKLVTHIRKKAREVAEKDTARWIINDGPPGIGCPVIASLSGTDLAIIVTEPSASALHDAQRLIELIKQFNLPVLAIINKCDINPNISSGLKSLFSKNTIPVIGEIPFNKSIVSAMILKKQSLNMHLIQI